VAPAGRDPPAYRSGSCRPIGQLSPTVGYLERPWRTVAAAGLIGLLVMHAVERRLDDADSGPGQVTASDLSWLAAAQAQAQRAASADTPTSAG